MWIYTVQVDSMMCGMCESPVNDAMRKALPVKKVSSSRSKKETTVVSEAPVAEDVMRQAISATGYGVLPIQSASYARKGLFSFGK